METPFNDPIIRHLGNQYNLPQLNVSEDLYFDLIENIISQQLSGKVAKAIFNRFCDLYPNGYPKPKLVVQTPIDSLRAAGLSQAKSDYVKALANFAINNKNIFDDMYQMEDQEIVRLLVQIRGIGVWTVQMLLIFSLNRANVFPIDDLAIRNGMQKLYGIQTTGKELRNEMLRIASLWNPNCTIATRYIWAYINDVKTKAQRI